MLAGGIPVVVDHGPRSGSASPPQSTASSQSPRLPIPPGLPRYDIDARLDLAGRKLAARERVTFTNRSKVPTSEMVLHVYPRYKVQDQDRTILSKTLELLRLSPEEAMDTQGRRLAVSDVRVAGRAVPFDFDPNLDTIMVVRLPQAVAPGGTVVTEIDFLLDLPDYWGRWGHHQGVTYLMNWYPVLAHHDDRGWERTPFVPWHQPWYQEAGHYTVRDLPLVRSSPRPGTSRGETTWPTIASSCNRRQSGLRLSRWSARRFEVQERQVGDLVRRFASRALATRSRCLTSPGGPPALRRWLGPTLTSSSRSHPPFWVERHECSGLVLIDDR